MPPPRARRRARHGLRGVRRRATFQPAQDLADGALPPHGALGAPRRGGRRGPAGRRSSAWWRRTRFTVDTHGPGAAPHPDPDATGATVGANPWFSFDAEEFAAFLCRWDGTGAFTACQPG